MEDVPAGQKPRRVRVTWLELLPLMLVAPMCLWATVLLSFFRTIGYTTSRIHIVLFFVCTGLSVAGFISAIVVGLRTSDEEKTVRGERMRRAALLLGILGIGAFCVLPRAVFGVREGVVYAECKMHLEQIGHELLLYASKNDGQFPPNLQTLVESGLDPNLFKCPGGPWRTPPVDPRNVDRTGDYYYARVQNDSVWGAPILWDKQSNHFDHGRNVLYADGHALCVNADELRSEVEESLEYYAAPPELPPPAPRTNR